MGPIATTRQNPAAKAPRALHLLKLMSRFISGGFSLPSAHVRSTLYNFAAASVGQWIHGPSLALHDQSSLQSSLAVLIAKSQGSPRATKLWLVISKDSFTPTSLSMTLTPCAGYYQQQEAVVIARRRSAQTCSRTAVPRPRRASARDQ